MMDEGIALRLPRREGPCWSRLLLPHSVPRDADNVADVDAEHTVDATFVDDEAIILIAKSPKLILSVLSRVLEVLVTTSAKLRMLINWSPGKTEAFLALRGKNSTQVRETLCCSDGRLRFPVKSTDAQLSIITEYKNGVCHNARWVQPCLRAQ